MLSRFRFKTKLLFGYGIILGVMIMVTVVVVISTKSLLNDFQWVVHTYKALDMAEKVETTAVDMQSAVQQFVMTGESKYLDTYKQEQNRFVGLTEKLRQTVSDNPQQVELMKDIDITMQNWNSKTASLLIEVRSHSKANQTLQQLSADLEKALINGEFPKFRQQIQIFKDREIALMEKRVAFLGSTESLVLISSIMGTILAVIIGLNIAFILTKFVMRKLGGEPAFIERIAKNVSAGAFHEQYDVQDAVGIYAEMLHMIETLGQKAELAERIAAGELNHKVTFASERDELAIALQKMNDNLNEVLGLTKQVSAEISHGSASVSQNSNDISARAAQQALSLERIAESLNELAKQISNNADSADKAERLTMSTRSLADAGEMKMHKMVEAMNDMAQASQSIAGYISTIDEIAKQTNLLALNAAIEAARAGEHGRGFAVVADEVRHLAARCTDTAERTAELISSSVEKTAHGSQVASETADSLHEIVSNINQTADLVVEIAKACKEQAIGAEKINSGVNDIDEITKQNSTNAKESAEAASKLASQAEQLQKLLHRFKLKQVN